MRSDRLRRVVLATALLLIPACSSSSRSFIVLKLKTSPGTAISGVDEVFVKVSNGQTEMNELTYGATGLTIVATPPTTLSVNFNDDERGEITFDVVARKTGGCVLGQGTAKQEIKPKDVVEVDVTMAPIGDCGGDGGTDGGSDGGSDGSTDGGVFPGCDPVTPSTCAATQTCQVNCATMRNECTAGGTGAPGAVCTSNADCQPGTQCFDYAGLGCQVKVCLRFCNSGADCTAFGAGGGGPGSLCEGPVQCPTFDTGYHTCTFNCDPTAKAAGAGGGCPSSLACVALAGMDQVDCTCPGTTRTKDVGATCTAGGADCKPGLVCTRMGSSTTSTCRAICRCNEVNGSCTATNECGGGQCSPITNSTIFGICL